MEIESLTTNFQVTLHGDCSLVPRLSHPSFSAAVSTFARNLQDVSRSAVWNLTQNLQCVLERLTWITRAHEARKDSSRL